MCLTPVMVVVGVVAGLVALPAGPGVPAKQRTTLLAESVVPLPPFTLEDPFIELEYGPQDSGLGESFHCRVPAKSREYQSFFAIRVKVDDKEAETVLDPRIIPYIDKWYPRKVELRPEQVDTLEIRPALMYRIPASWKKLEIRPVPFQKLIPSTTATAILERPGNDKKDAAKRGGPRLVSIASVILPLNPESPRIRVEYCNQGETPLEFDVPDAPQPLKHIGTLDFPPVEVRIDGKAAQLVSADRSDATTKKTKKVGPLRPQQYSTHTFSLSQVYVVPEGWKRIEVSPADVSGITPAIKGRVVLER